MCGKGTLKPQVVEYAESGVALGSFKASVCDSCGEQFFDAEIAKAIQKKSKQAGLFGLARKAKVAQVGNSLAIRIHKEIAEFLHLKKEGEVKLLPKSPSELIIEIG